MNDSLKQLKEILKDRWRKADKKRFIQVLVGIIGGLSLQM